jgi:hypothetical protein
MRSRLFKDAISSEDKVCAWVGTGVAITVSFGEGEVDTGSLYVTDEQPTNRHSSPIIRVVQAILFILSIL